MSVMCEVLRLSNSCWCYFSRRDLQKLNNKPSVRRQGGQRENAPLTMTRCNELSWKIYFWSSRQHKDKNRFTKKQIVDTSIKATEWTPPRVSPLVPAFLPPLCLKKMILAQQSFKHQIDLTWTDTKNLDMFFDLTDLRLSPYVWSDIL